jgi:hypothetical protein
MSQYHFAALVWFSGQLRGIVLQISRDDIDGIRKMLKVGDGMAARRSKDPVRELICDPKICKMMSRPEYFLDNRSKAQWMVISGRLKWSERMRYSKSEGELNLIW